MPILAAEPDLYPEELLDEVQFNVDDERNWWAMYCLPRFEKKLMRKLREAEVAHYCPLVPRRRRSPGGRVRTAHIPLFPGYVFVCGNGTDRYRAVSTGCVSRCLEVSDGDALRRDLSQIHCLIHTGATLTPESRLARGGKVRISSGPFAGVEGVVVHRENKSRLLVAVNYLRVS